MLFDTHCHLNFNAFKDNLDEVINSAKNTGIKRIIVPGTDLKTSEKAIEIANQYEGIYAAIGIHPHHVYEAYFKNKTKDIINRKNVVNDLVNSLSKLLSDKKVVAVGEVGIDRHYYQKTKHQDYKINEEFINLQKEFFLEQIKLANKYKKALIIHNREAKQDTLKILSDYRFKIIDYRSVFHCCEPDEKLLEYAKSNKMFIGVDGDVFYNKEKQEFVKKIPIEMLVLETDSPYLSPFKKFPNEPKNILYIAEFIADLKKTNIKEIEEKTTNNAKTLFEI